MIYVSSLAGVTAAFASCTPSHVITLLNPEDDKPALGLDDAFHLKVGMNDILVRQPGFTEPCETHAREILRFLEVWPRERPLLVHCWAGVSRSTATAFITLCRFNRPGAEKALAARLRAAAPHARPNRLLVHHADRILGRGGRMVAAVDGMGEASFVDEGPLFAIPVFSSEAASDRDA